VCGHLVDHAGEVPILVLVRIHYLEV
jgi:hypothetical protein